MRRADGMQRRHGRDNGALRINVPDGFPVGAIFGKGAVNIKRLQEMTRGGRVYVKKDCTMVTVSGPGARSVISDLEQQFASHSQHVHSTAVRKIVSLKIETADTLAAFLPSFPSGVVAADIDCNEQLYTLVPASMRPGSSGTAYLGSLNNALSKLSIVPTTPTTQSFYTAADQTAMQREILDYFKSGRALQTAFNQIKFRANLGTQFFYAPPLKKVPGGICSYRQVQEIQIGSNKDMRAIYSNALEKEQATAVRSHLLKSMGFRSTDNKETIALHVSDEKGASHVISFINASGDLKLRKLKSRDAKLFILTELGGRSVDFRFKLMGQYHIEEGTTGARKLTALADSCSLLDGVLQMPRDMGLSLTMLRHKSKEKLAGTFMGDNGEQVDLHVTISLVRRSSTESGVVDDNGHYEITIGIPALTEALNSNPASSLGTAELRQMTAFVQFFQKLEPVVPENH